MDTLKELVTLPYLEIGFVDGEGKPVDCSDFMVKLFIRSPKGTVKQVVVGQDNAPWVTQEDSSSGELVGQAVYMWDEADLDEAGIYQFEYKFTRLADGKKFTVPTKGYYSFKVEPDQFNEEVTTP